MNTATRSPDLHAQIMNLPCEPSVKEATAHHAPFPDDYITRAWRLGHKQARHAAAELAAAHDKATDEVAAAYAAVCRERDARREELKHTREGWEREAKRLDYLLDRMTWGATGGEYEWHMPKLMTKRIFGSAADNLALRLAIDEAIKGAPGALGHTV